MWRHALLLGKVPLFQPKACPRNRAGRASREPLAVGNGGTELDASCTVSRGRLCAGMVTERDER